MEKLGPERYRFADFQLDAGARQLLRGEEAVALTPKEFQTLLMLVQARGHALEREFLMRSIWPDTVVGDTSLGRNISMLRRHLGAAAIESVPRFGYRFGLPVTLEEPASSAAAATQTTAAAANEIAATTPPHGTHTPRPWPFWNALSPLLTGGRLIALALVILAVGLAAMGARQRGSRIAAAGPADPVRLAVLPFRNVSANTGESDYLRDGMADELTSRLGQLRLQHLQVLARSTTRQYVDTAKPAAAIAAETGARYLLEGSVGFDRNEARVTVNLVDAQTQAIVWSRVLERPMNELPTLQEEIANSIATNPALAGTERLRPGALESTLPEAHDAYLRGRYELAQRRRESYQKALTHFERAVELDPQYAKGYAGIAEAYIYMTDTFPLTDCYARSRDAVMTALRLDEDLSDAHRDLAYLQINERNDAIGAEREFRRALDLNPDDARTHHWYAQMLAAQRRNKESLEQAKAGYQLDPRSVGSMANYGYLLVQAGELDRGKQMLEATLKLDPGSEMTWGYLGTAYLRLGRFTDSAAAYDRAAAFESFSASYLADAAYARAKAGDTTGAHRVLTLFTQKLEQREWFPAQAMALTEIALGEKAQARVWLRKGSEDHSVTLFELNNEPFFSEMKDDPLFTTLVAEAAHVH